MNTTFKNIFNEKSYSFLQDQNRVMIIFETPQSSRSKIKVTLERLEAELPDVDVDEIRLLNPYNMLITIPSE